MFPELLYALSLANIMSPKLWAWRDHEWFAKLDKMTPYRRILRLKQFIIDHYEFNLDLDTWGLTTKEREIDRFRPWMDEATIGAEQRAVRLRGRQVLLRPSISGGTSASTSTRATSSRTGRRRRSRRWTRSASRTATRTGAGECVSLSTLYAAAMFVVCRIPLEDIFLLATPLHSQNFIDTADGVLTNNRRVVTKNMWFNGTELTEKAQRALGTSRSRSSRTTPATSTSSIPRRRSTRRRTTAFQRSFGAFCKRR